MLIVSFWAVMMIQNIHPEVEDVTIVPTVKSALVSTRKAKLPITPSTLKAENWCNLKDYYTNASKGSAGVHVRDLNSGYLKHAPAIV